MKYYLRITHLQHFEYVPLLSESECDLKSEIAAFFTARCHEPELTWRDGHEFGSPLAGTVEAQTGVYIEGLGTGDFSVVAESHLRLQREHEASMRVAFGDNWRSLLDEEANSYEERIASNAAPANRKIGAL